MGVTVKKCQMIVIDVHLELYFCSIVHSCVLFNCLIKLMMMMMMMMMISVWKRHRSAQF